MTYGNNVPRDRATMNAWFRSVYLTREKHHNDIDRYTECIDSLILYVTDINTRKRIINDLLVVGESFFSVSKTSPMVVEKFYNSDYINVRRSTNPGDLVYAHYYQRVDDKDDPLEEGFRHIANYASPYDVRGTSIFMPFLQDIADDKDFSILPKGEVAYAVFEKTCFKYAERINNSFRNANKKSKTIPVNNQITRVG